MSIATLRQESKGKFTRNFKFEQWFWKETFPAWSAPVADVWRWLNVPYEWATTGSQTHTIQLAILGGGIALFILFRARK